MSAAATGLDLEKLPDLPYAHGGPCGSGRIRVVAEDFVVREWLGFEADGEGDHWLLKVRKRGANTHWVVKQLSRLSGIPQRDIGFAGLKDRHAVTEQSFSLPVRSAPGSVVGSIMRSATGSATGSAIGSTGESTGESSWLGMTGEGFEVIEAVRHRRKLKRGALKGNDFEIVVRDFSGDAATLDARIAAIAARGVPNYFGPQRFGVDGGNLARARRLFAGEHLHDRLQRGFALSAARAAIFNAVLAQRVSSGYWDVLQAGDMANLDGSNSVFAVDRLDAALLDRCHRQDIHPTGPLWGQGELQTRGAVAALEQHTAAQLAPLGAGLAQAGLEQERRSLRLRVADLRWTLEAGQLRLRFRLPRGAFATAVLHELIAGIFGQAQETEEE